MKKTIVALSIAALTCGCATPPASKGVANSSSSAGVQATESPSAQLVGDQSIKVDAFWEIDPGDGIKQLLDSPEGKVLIDVKPAEASRVYSMRDLAPLMPPSPTEVGDTWSISEAATSFFLSQFSSDIQPRMSIGDSGAYGVVRAQSETKLEVRMRWHAQLQLGERAVFNPAQFAGKIVLDRAEGKIEFFQVSVPTDHYRNVDWELFSSKGSFVGLGFIRRMELVSGEATDYKWQSEISEQEAEELLARKFYKFEAVDWQPMERALELSKQEKKKVLAIVIEGALTDQSC